MERPQCKWAIVLSREGEWILEAVCFCYDDMDLLTHPVPQELWSRWKKGEQVQTCFVDAHYEREGDRIYDQPASVLIFGRKKVPKRYYYVCQICKGVHLCWLPMDGKCRRCGKAGTLVWSDQPKPPEYKCPRCNGVIGGTFDLEMYFDLDKYVAGKPLEHKIVCPCCDESIVVEMATPSFTVRPK